MQASPLPLIIAHRGASALAPENTMAAFDLALRAGADGIELDVMLSADAELVVIHDATVDRTTNGSGQVSAMTWAELRELDAGSHFSPEFQSERLPRLAEVYEAFGGKFLINVELKNYAHPMDELTEKAVLLTQQYGLSEKVIFSSFNPFNLTRAHRLDPRIRLGLLTNPGTSGALLRGPLGGLFPHQALHPYFKDVSKTMVQKAHQQGRQVNPWTVNEAADLRRMCDLGVDMIICNDPIAARQVLGA